MATLKVTNIKNESFAGDQLYLKSDGRLGIGTTSPTGDLEILGSLGLIIGNASGSGKLFADGGSTKVGSKTNHRLDLITNDTHRVSIDTSGKVGIGTTSPAGKLTVHNTDDSNVNVFEVYNDNGNMSGSFSQSSTGDGTVGVRKNDGTLSVFFRSNGISYLNGGNVGIGTTTPGRQLSIVNSSGAIVEITTNTSGNTSALYLHEGAIGSTSNGGAILYDGANNKVAICCGTTLTTERITIERDSGDVEIGGNLKTNNLSGRNLLINGDFSVWQRGVSFSIAAPTYTADRWNVYGASTSVIAITRESFNVGQTDVTDNPKYIFRMSNVPDADSTWMQMYQRIEDVTQFSNTQLTISFWIRTNNATNNYYWQFVQRFGSGGSTAVQTNTSTFNTTTSWVKHTLTVTVPSISGKTIGSGNNLEVHFLNNSTTGNDTYIDFANIQVEKGSIATPFERRSYGEELARCQRYYYLAASGASKALGLGVNYTASEMHCAITYPVTMRTTPTLDVASGNNYYEFIRNGSADWVDDFTLGNRTTDKIGEIYNQTDISGTAGHGGFVRTDNASAKVAFSAEL